MTISSDSPDRLMVDAGTLTVGGTDIGATLGGATFVVEMEQYAPKLDGVRGPAKGVRWITQEIPKLTCRLTEVQMAKVQWALPGSSLASDASSELLSDTTVGYIATGDYNDVIFTGTKPDGNTVIITVNDATATSNLTMSFTDEGLTVYEVEFTGHYDPSDPDDAPWDIKNNIA